MSTTAPRADAAAASVGAADLFVLRRVTGNRFVHFGGSGRGAGWAGLIEVVDGRGGARSREALRTRRPVRSPTAARSSSSARTTRAPRRSCPVTNDVVVVFGCEDDELEAATDESARSPPRRSAPRRSSRSTPAKRLADELEELEAVRAALAVDADDVEAAMRDARARSRRESLSCELGRRLPRRRRAARASSSAAGRCARTGDDVAAALHGVLGDGRFPYCVQDASVVPLPAPLDDEPGIRSYYLLELHGLARGVLLRRAHRRRAARLHAALPAARRCGSPSVASAQLGVALTREWCSEEAVSASRGVREARRS